MSIISFATLALAAGLATAKPIAAPQPQSSNNIFGLAGKQGFNGAVINGFNGQGFNFADGFNNFNEQQQVIQIQEQNLQIVDNGFRQQVVQQVNQVLVVDQVNNGFNNNLNNLFRKSNFRNQFQQVATVMLVVQEIQVAVDNGRGGVFQQNVFAQSAVIANRGARQTQTIMVFDQRKLVAQDILRGNAFGNIQQFGGIAGATGALNKAFPTKTQGVQLFGSKPTWSAVAADPAATLGGVWQDALQDLQKNDNDQKDNELNNQIAAEEKKKLDEAQNQQQQEQQNKDQQAQDQQAQDQQNKDEQNKDEQNKDQQAQDQQAQDQQKQEEQKAMEGQQAAQNATAEA